MIGQADDFVHTGELRGIWGHMARGDVARCGCGKTLRECEFWGQVLSRANIDQSVDGLRRLAELQRGRLRARPRSLWRLRRGLHHPSSDSELRAIAERLESEYNEIAALSGKTVIVDSTKVPTYGALVSRLVDVDTYVLHLVRDPRAVAYSWRRRGMYGVDFRPFRSSSAWLLANWLTERLVRGLPDGRTMFLRYEDFVQDPRQTVDGIFDWLNLSGKRLEWVDDRTIRLSPSHTVGGNPTRFISGLVNLSSDDEWRSQMTARDVAMATLPALPLLHRYGYPVTGSRSKSSGRSVSAPGRTRS
jgi:hypothetical protein